jgi:hypothetical protein
MAASLTEQEAIERLRKQGYREDFRFEAEGIRHPATDRLIEAGSVEIVEVLRIEGDSDVDGSSIVMGVRTGDGATGVLVCAFGPGLTAEIGEQLRSMPRAAR